MSGHYDAPDGSDRMIFPDSLHVVVRIMLAGFGAMTFLAPWELLIRPGHPFTFGALPFWFIAIGALSVGVPILFGALLGFERTLTLDFEGRRFVETTTAAFGLRFTRAHRFEDLVALDVVEHDWSDGPTEWDVTARFATARRPWSIRRLGSEASARALVDEIRLRMDRRVV